MLGESIPLLRQLRPASRNMESESLEQILHHILMHEQSRAGAPPASEELIASLPRISVNEYTNIDALGECLISFDKFAVGDIAISLPCGHTFKAEEIEKWLRVHSTCPCCRVVVTSSDVSQINDSSR